MLCNKLYDRFDVMYTNVLQLLFAFYFSHFLYRMSIRGLSTAVEIELIKEIVAVGGIKSVVARSLCNNNPELFGQPNSELQRQVQNKTAYWKRTKSLNEFEKEVQQLGIDHQPRTGYRDQVDPDRPV